MRQVSKPVWMIDPKFKSRYRDFCRSAEFLGGGIDIFQETTPSHLIYSSLTTRLSEYFRFLRRKSIKFKIFSNSLRWGFVFNKTPNAYAWKSGGFYCIGITSGLIHLLLEAALRHMADNRVFSCVAFDELNKTTVPITANYLSKYFSHEAPNEAIYYRHEVYPDNEYRKKCAEALFSLSIIFVVMHELGHCLMGHLDSDFFDVIKEIEGDAEEFHDNRLRMMAEHQADNIAILITLDNPPPRMQQPGIVLAEWNALWSISIDMVFWLFCKGPILPHSETRTKHPHPQMRLAHKTLRLLELSDRVKVNYEDTLGQKINSLGVLGAGLSLQMAKDWTTVGLALGGWSIFESDEILASQIHDLSEFLLGNREIATKSFKNAKLDIIQELSTIV